MKCKWDSSKPWWEVTPPVHHVLAVSEVRIQNHNPTIVTTFRKEW